MLRDIAEAENLSHLNAQVYDIQDANLSEMYDFIGCTVTLMFLNPATVAEVIANMQEHTRQGGYNVIVCAMDTAQYPRSEERRVGREPGRGYSCAPEDAAMR